MRCFVVVLLALYLLPVPAPAWKADIVKAWAQNLGNELWQLSETLTKSTEIRRKYKQMNASVKEKDGKKILESSLRSVSTMMKKKVNAVKCIHATAEMLAQEFDYEILKDKTYSNFSYCSAKYSNFTNEDIPKDYKLEKVPDFAKNNSNYVDVELERDSHFYDINVDTNQSCVQVPTNIYYKERDPLGAILWSESLNEVFLTNYKSDPSLSWQYFGSSHGILRFYPAMPWNRHEVDTYDCRVQSWYIEAATCSKDVIILFDVSGSMTGFKNYVARRTLGSLLDTLSNNDYVNVFTFNKNTSVVVECFEGLVQATQENLWTIRERLDPSDPKQKPMPPLEGNANLTMAFIQAFNTLKNKANKCDVSSSQGCNQMVMLITDYVPGNLTEVFEEHNRKVVDNKTYIPVRVFTYLIGKEVTNVAEIQWMACANRGYYVHIHSVEEVQQQVLKYINVIARPMILVKKNPPPTWTHANIDKTRTKNWQVSKDMDDPDEDKLVTSVAIPAFDLKHNEDNNDAILLGVAGTDVPIDSIAKLAQPHQLGVNGYSFIVSNNGYLLLHPLLITSRNGKLQVNYNSVDFVEVEQVDDGKDSRELGSAIKELRQALVEGKEGKIENIPVLYHYDVMRRIARVKHDYFYNKLEDTPFSMGISLPKDYGNTELFLKDNPLEVKKGQMLTGINVTDYFRFNYRVHPKWVYCKYHYLEGHETDNAEIETWQFLVEISKKAVDITKTQYLYQETKIPFKVETHCGNGTTLLETDDYYCNEDLVKQLVFDAKLSSPYFETWAATESDKELAKTYNVDVRFIATASGLTRWHYIFDDDKNEHVDDHGVRNKRCNESVFGDKNKESIEETWYKAAVLQHMVHKESLVVSTRLPILDETITQKHMVIENGDITITAAYAIFYKDGKSETPASVVGFDFSFLSFYERFLEITKKNWNENKEISCEDDRLYDCYLVDSSGYFVLAKEKEDVGKFLGVLHPYVMESLIDKEIFDHVEVFNYQALCPEESFSKVVISSGWSVTTPFDVVTGFMKWLLIQLLIIITDVYKQDEYVWADTIGDYSDLTESTEGTTAAEPPMSENITEPHNSDEDKYYSCDHRISLYILNQSHFHDNTSPVVYEDEKRDCHPPYWAAHVIKTNLLLLVVKKVDTSSYSHCNKSPDTTPVPTTNSTKSKEPCHKLDLGALYRRPLEGCYTYHEKERNITACGKGSNLQTDVTKSLTALLFIVLRYVAFLHI